MGFILKTRPVQILVAAYARTDVVAPARANLVRPSRVSDQASANGDKVGLSTFKQRLPIFRGDVTNKQ